MNGKHILKGFVVPFSFLMLLQCSSPTNHAGNATQAGNARGRLAKADGSPAAGVTVYFFDVANNPQPISGNVLATMAATDSAVTDSLGNYADSLAVGTYNMMAADDTAGVFQDSVEVVDGDTTTFADDTLRPFGSLTGTIVLEQDGDVRTVFVLVFGTNTWTAPDANGRFSLSNMAEGEYSVRILTSLDKYEVKDTSFTVASGRADTLADAITLKYTGIPTVKGVGITYDTLKQIVIMAWNKDDTSQVKGYNVYRRHIDSSFSSTPLNGVLITDTLYFDSTATQDETYEYKVTAVDHNDNEGLKREGDTVTVVSAFDLIDSVIHADFECIAQIRKSSIGQYIAISYLGEIIVMDSLLAIIRRWGQEGSDSSEFNNPYSIALDNEDYIYVADMRNNRIQKFDSLGNFILQWGTNGTETGQFRNPYFIDIDFHNRIYVCERLNNRIQVFNTEGMFLLEFGSTGSGNGQFDGFGGIAVDKDGFLYVGDVNNARVQKFDSNGVFVEEWTSINSPHCVLSDGKYVVLLEDYGSVNPKLDMFDPSGTLMAINNPKGILLGFFDGAILTRIQGINPTIYRYASPGIAE